MPRIGFGAWQWHWRRCGRSSFCLFLNILAAIMSLTYATTDNCANRNHKIWIYDDDNSNSSDRWVNRSHLHLFHPSRETESKYRGRKDERENARAKKGIWANNNIMKIACYNWCSCLKIAIETNSRHARAPYSHYVCVYRPTFNGIIIFS